MIAALLFASVLPFAQLAAEPATPPVTVNPSEDRLFVCLDHARKDPTTAIVEANDWNSELGGSGTTYAQQCLGMAYTALLRWPAAEQAFVAAREAADTGDRRRRAQLGAMAANAALAEGSAAAALAYLNLAATDAAAGDDAGLRAVIETDRARAQVLQGDEEAAELTLANARALDAQSPFAWLLSATLARRLGKLEEAQGFIEKAAALSPGYPETGLEAGVIAMLSGREDAARASWQSVIDLDAGGEAAATARGYLAQLDPVEEAPPAE